MEFWSVIRIYKYIVFFSSLTANFRVLLYLDI